MAWCIEIRRKRKKNDINNNRTSAKSKRQWTTIILQAPADRKMGHPERLTLIPGRRTIRLRYSMKVRCLFESAYDVELSTISRYLPLFSVVFRLFTFHLQAKAQKMKTIRKAVAQNQLRNRECKMQTPKLCMQKENEFSRFYVGHSDTFNFLFFV